MLDIQVSQAKAEEAAGDAPIVRPIFEPGDALFFDELFLHQTASDPSMPNPRYAIENWFFGSSSFPVDYAPVAALVTRSLPDVDPYEHDPARWGTSLAHTAELSLPCLDAAGVAVRGRDRRLRGRLHARARGLGRRARRPRERDRSGAAAGPRRPRPRRMRGSS